MGEDNAGTNQQGAAGEQGGAPPPRELPPVKVKVHSSNFKQEMYDQALDISRRALLDFKIEKDAATNIKKSFDEKFEPTWQCIVGKRFGCSITHDTSHLLFMQIDQVYILLFKSHE